MEGGCRQKQRDIHRPPCRLRQEGGLLCAITGFIGPTSSRGVPAAELTGVVTHYRGVRPNNNNDNNDNNNHAALADRFYPSTLHKLRQLGLYTNTDTPDTAHQLDAEAVTAEVAYTMTNTQPSCSASG